MCGVCPLAIFGPSAIFGSGIVERMLFFSERECVRYGTVFAVPLFFPPNVCVCVWPVLSRFWIQCFLPRGVFVCHPPPAYFMRRWWQPRTCHFCALLFLPGFLPSLPTLLISFATNLQSFLPSTPMRCTAYHCTITVAFSASQAMLACRPALTQSRHAPAGNKQACSLFLSPQSWYRLLPLRVPTSGLHCNCLLHLLPPCSSHCRNLFHTLPLPCLSTPFHHCHCSRRLLRHCLA